MKIAVITPYYKESIEFLRQCHQSVLDQNVSADHFFVADGFPNAELMKWNIKHISLPQSHGDFGDTPRGIASILADVEGYDFIAYLDADNWFLPNHLSSLLKLYEETKADVCTSIRKFYTLNGLEMNIHELDEHSLKHVDTSCYFLHRNVFDALDIWLKMPYSFHEIGDRVFYHGLKSKNYRFASTKQKTLAYRSNNKAHYLAAKIEPPIDCKEAVHKVLTSAEVKEILSKLGFVPF